MTILYVATDANRLKVIEIDDETGKFVRLIQEIDPIVNDTLIANASTGGANNNIDYDDDGSASTLGSYLGGIIGGTGTTKATTTMTMTTTTEWIERHPTFPLLYVFTSFFNKAISIVTTYRIIGGSINDDCNSDKIMKGRLKKLGEIQTGGMHVSHVTFSPDSYYASSNNNNNNTTMCVGHYIDGHISFFDCSQDGAALQDPVRIVVLPEVRPETRNTTFPNCLPSIHHVTYNPYPNNNVDDKEEKEQEEEADVLICRYLLVSDTSKQGRVWTYEVNSKGIPSSGKPISSRKVTLITPPPGWLSQLVNWSVGLANYRIRRCVVHPNGLYVYILLEFNAVIQVYEINPYTGRMSGDCLQEIPTIDPEYFGGSNQYNNSSSSSSSSSKFTGMSIHAPAELSCTTNELFVSNRGFNYGGPGSRFSFGKGAESGVRIFTIEDNGLKLVPKQNLNCCGPVRHFFHNNNNDVVNKLYVGSDKTAGRGGNNSNHSGVNNTSASIETFVRRQPEALGGEFERVGSPAHVGMDTITCIALLE